MIPAVLGERYRLGERIAGANPVAIATQHVSAPVPDPRADLPDLPAPAADLIRRALAKHPADRFPSATALADALSTAANPDPQGRARRAARWPRGARGNPTPRCRGPRRGSVAQSRPGCRSLSTGPGGPVGRRWRWGRSS